MRPSSILLLGLLVGCGSGSTPDTSVTVTQTNNQNQNSQNGEAECTFECEPTELAGQAGFAVTQVCSGVIQNGPNFFQAPPVGCSFSEPVEGEKVVVNAEQESTQVSEAGIDNEGSL